MSLPVLTNVGSNYDLFICVFIILVNVTQLRIIWEESLIEGLSMLGWLMGVSVRDYFN